MPDGLISARLKLDRARAHADELSRLIRSEYDEAQGDTDAPSAVTFRKQLTEGRDAFLITVASVRHPADQCAVVLGDALHNFRSALDHVAWELATRHKGGTPSGSTAFPVRARRADFDAPSVARALADVSEADRERITNLQPFRQAFTHGSEHPLVSLNAMSNHDKHRLLHFAALGPQQISLAGDGRRNTDCEITAVGVNEEMIGKPLEPGTLVAVVEIRRTGPAPDIAMRVRCEAAVSVRGGLPVETQLALIGSRVEEAIGVLLGEG